MGRNIVYCPICGCPFEDISTEFVEGEFQDEVLTAAMTKWLGVFRVIGKCNFSSEHKEESATPFSISPPASGAEFRSVYIENTSPNGTEWSCFDGQKWQIYDQNDSGVVLYPMHDACMSIVNRIAVQHSMCGASKYGSLEAYYNAMLRLHQRNTEYPYSTPLEEEVAKYTAYPSEYGAYKLEWEHHYYGAARFADGSSWVVEPNWEWLCADPSTIDGLTSYILSHLIPLDANDEAQPNPPTASPLASNHHSVSAIESLPTEILASITSFLPTTASLHLGRCSQTLTSRIPLSQTFWRDQLLHKNLVDYLWDLNPSECHEKDKEGRYNWNALVRNLLKPTILQSALAQSLNGEMDEFTTPFERASLHETGFRDAPIGLQNRCRIVRIVRDIERLDEIEAEEPVVLEEDGSAVKQRHMRLFASLEAVS